MHTYPSGQLDYNNISAFLSAIAIIKDEIIDECIACRIWDGTAKDLCLLSLIPSHIGSKLKISYYRSLQDYGISFISEEFVNYGENGHVPLHEMRIDIGGTSYFYENIYPDPVNVTVDLTSYLNYSKKFAVTFEEFRSNPGQVSIISVAYYEPHSQIYSSNYPQHPDIEYYKFDKWVPAEVKDLESNIEIEAQYLENKIVIKLIKDTYKHDGEEHFFEVVAELNNNPEKQPNIEYSEDGIIYSSDKIGLTNLGAEKTVYYKIYYSNYKTITGNSKFKIVENKLNVTLSYRRDLDEEFYDEYILNVEYGQSAIIQDIVNNRYMWTNDGWDKDISYITHDLTANEIASKRIYDNYIHSLLSINTEILTCEIFESISPLAICDLPEHAKYEDRDILSCWYEYDKDGNKAIVSLDQFKSLLPSRATIIGNKGKGFEVYPDFYRIFFLSAYVMSSDCNILNVYSVISGNSKPSSEIELPTIANWHFERWNPESWNPINNDIDITAIYAKDLHVVTINGDYAIKTVKIGSSSGTDVVSGREYDHGTRLYIKGSYPSDSQYDYSNLQLLYNGTAIENESIHSLTSNATITISCSRTLKTFNMYAYGSTGGSASVDKSSVQYGGSATWTATNDAGYHFTSWSNSSTSNPYTIDNITNNISLTAYFEKDNHYWYVNFNGNGNDGGSMLKLTISVDVPTALTLNGFTHNTKNFAGWSSSSTGNVEYTDGKEVNNLTSEGRTKELYAIWLNPKCKATITVPTNLTSESITLTCIASSPTYSEAHSESKTISIGSKKGSDSWNYSSVTSSRNYKTVQLTSSSSTYTDTVQFKVSCDGYDDWLDSKTAIRTQQSTTEKYLATASIVYSGVESNCWTFYNTNIYNVSPTDSSKKYWCMYLPAHIEGFDPGTFGVTAGEWKSRTTYTYSWTVS